MGSSGFILRKLLVIADLLLLKTVLFKKINKSVLWCKNILKTDLDMNFGLGF